MTDDMPPSPKPEGDADILTELLREIENTALQISKHADISEIHKFFSMLKQHKISKWNGLWDVALFLACSILVRKYKATSFHLQRIYDLWSRLPRPYIDIFHGPYVVPEFWQPHLKDENMFQHFQNYLARWCSQSEVLTWDAFAEDLQLFFTHKPPILTSSQSELLLAIIKYQTDSTNFLSKKLNRSDQAISKEKKALYQKRVIHKSLWVNFFKLQLRQRTLLLFHEPMRGARALVNPSCPWLFSHMTAYLFNRYSILTFLVPHIPGIERHIFTLKEQFMNTSDVTKIYDFEPDLSKRPPLITVNYSAFNFKDGAWSFEVGYPLTHTRLPSSDPNAIYITSSQRIASLSQNHDEENPRFSQKTIQALSLFYQKGLLSIRELEKEMQVSFHTARKIHKEISTAKLVSERFFATLGSTLNTLYVLVDAPDEIIEQLRAFLTNLPEQQVFDVKGEITGLQGYVRVPAQFTQDTITAIEKIVRPHSLIAMPVIGGQDIRWKIPYERWDEATQAWIIDDHDFALFEDGEF